MLEPKRIEQLEYVVNRVFVEATNTVPKRNWQQFTESELWYHLVSCILGSRTKYENSQAAADFLYKNSYLKPPSKSGSFANYQKKILTALSKPIFAPVKKDGMLSKYRYPKSKAKQIRVTAEYLYRNSNGLIYILSSSPDEATVRRKIIDSCLGVGPKQSSMFLRNIGFNNNVAILDVHVLRYMHMIGLLSRQMESVSRLQDYENVEKKLIAYADKQNKDIYFLDYAIWVVMRVYQNQKIAWA